MALTRQQKIDELLKDNKPKQDNKSKHIDEMEIFKQKVDEQIERLNKKQMELLEREDNEEMHELTNETYSEDNLSNADDKTDEV